MTRFRLFLMFASAACTRGFSVLPSTCTNNFRLLTNEKQHPSFPLGVTGTVLREGTEASLQGDDAEDEGGTVEQIPLIDQYRIRMSVLAKRSSRDSTAVEQAQALIQEAEQQDYLAVDIDLYNLLWETYAYATHWEDGAGEILQAIQQRLDDSDTLVKPNLESYAVLVEGYAQRKNLQRLENLLDQLENEISQEHEHLTPDINFYSKILWAYGVMRQPDKAKALFQRLITKSGALSESDDVDPDASLRPNAKAWVQLLRALALSGRIDEIKEQLELMAQGYEDFGYEDWKVNANCYNTLILALANDGSDPPAAMRTNSAWHEAEAIVYEMIQAHREEKASLIEMGLDEDESDGDGSDSMCANRETFSLLFQCFRGETGVGVAAKVEKLLELQQALADTEPESWRISADTRTYNVAISVLSRSRDSKKAVRAQRILQTMMESDADDAEPSLVTYRNIMNACAFTRGTPEENLEAYQVAVRVFNLVRENEGSISDDEKHDAKHNNMMGNIYHLFIKASFNLMAPSSKRDNVVERIFRKCCQDGYCSTKVLEEISRGGSEGLQLKLLGGFAEDGIQTRPEWSRNVHSSFR